MTMSWLMTVQEAGIPHHMLLGGSLGIQFDLTPRWISSGHIDDEPPNLNCFGTLRRWPSVVEIRRPDGTHVSAEARPLSMHLNYAYKDRAEYDAAGRVRRLRNPWIRVIVLKGVSVADVPFGSEIWGEITDEDVQAPRDRER